MQVFAIYDAKVGAFGHPIFVRSEGEAVRSFTTVVRQPGSQIHEFPQDFALYALGSFDEKEGLFNCGQPRQVVSANVVLTTLNGGVVDAN